MLIYCTCSSLQRGQKKKEKKDLLPDNYTQRLDCKIKTLYFYPWAARGSPQKQTHTPAANLPHSFVVLKREKKGKWSDVAGKLFDETCGKCECGKGAEWLFDWSFPQFTVKAKESVFEEVPGTGDQCGQLEPHSLPTVSLPPLHLGQLAAVESRLARPISGGGDGGVCENCGLPENQCIHTVCPSITRPFIHSEGGSVKSRIP